MKRSAGILLPIFSLPSPHGIGCFSKEAYQWVDLLAGAGQSWWQILPVGPTSYGDSPYQSYSTYAGNPYFIDLEELIKAGYLTARQVEECDLGRDPGKVDYGKLYRGRTALLQAAYETWEKNREQDAPAEELASFCEESAFWLEDYALFMAVKDSCGGRAWQTWPEDIRLREETALKAYRDRYEERIGFYRWLQYLFFKQWKKLKAYANARQVRIIGDIPIYVAYDSADVWAQPELFQLDEDRRPRAVAGCPPDGFAADGQLWGNPLYRWEEHKRTGYAWWLLRLDYCFRLYDVLRIDHFRGFDEYFSIPASDTNAKNGKWEKGPGMELFTAVKEKLGEKQIIAEDLGYVTDSVRQLVRNSGFPNMKVLEFAFDSRDSTGARDYLPHNYGHNCVCYTGTHDNETVVGFLSSILPSEKEMVRRYLGRMEAGDEELARGLVRLALSSVADLCIIPVQDYLLLDNSARINYPSSLGGNWCWRLREGQIGEGTMESIRQLTTLYGRE